MNDEIQRIYHESAIYLIILFYKSFLPLLFRMFHFISFQSNKYFMYPHSRFVILIMNLFSYGPFK